MIYDQGDIIEVGFDPARGHEPSKKRPALAVRSSYGFNRSNSMTIVCPISSNMTPFFLHEELPENCCVQGTVIMEQLRSLDLNARPTKWLGRLEADALEPILICVKSFFEFA